VELAVRGYWNRILAAGPRSLAARQLRAAAARHPGLRAVLPRLALRTLRG